MSYQAWGYTAVSGGGAGALDAEDGAGILDDAFAVVLDGYVKYFKFDIDSGLVANGTTIVAPVTNAGDGRWILQPGATDYRPIAGTVTAFIPGYFTSNANGGYTSTVTTAAAINALINPGGEYYCNGAACNVSGSTYYDGAGRYLPNITDDRFLQGDTVCGVTGGSNTLAHDHPTSAAILTQAQAGIAEYADMGLGNSKLALVPRTGGATSHGHGDTGSSGNLENRAKFLSVFYKIQVT